jgi:hypothetical protein
MLLTASRRLLAGLLLLLATTPLSAEEFHRLYDGVTLYVDNPEGRGFDISLDVIDTNLYENGAREVLFKAYDAAGKSLIREVIPDDGVTSKAYLPPMGAWDHEAWYYAFLYMQGTQPMWRWSAPSQPDRLAHAPKRTIKRTVAAGQGGVWRILLVGATDHYVKVTLDPELKYGIAGHPDWVHGHGKMFERSHLYVPRGARGVHLMLAEFDVPRTRKVTLKAPDGSVLHELTAPGGAASAPLDFEPGLYDDKLLTLEVGPGEGDFMMNAKFRFGKDPEVTQRGERVVPAVFATDAATATALRGGAIYHDDRVFWQPYAVKLHDWLKTVPEESYIVRNEAGEVVLPTPPPPRPTPVKKGETPPQYLPSREGYLPLNGRHWKPPLSDVILYQYPAHKNQAALNLAVRDLIYGLRSIGPNDHVAVATGGPYANLAYEFGAYAWHYWRPSWRLVHETNVPDDLKLVVKEAMLVCGDRLSFCRSWERVNGNSYALVLSALRYCYATTGDELQQQLFDVYWDRFTNGGWGDRVGVGPSGPVQEGFAYAYHYGSYIMESWPSVLADFQDERFQKVYDRIHNWWSYTACDEQVPTGPWCARTHHYPQWFGEKEIEGPYAFKGLPGPDFTVGVNDYNEWFAARRKNYYVLTYHGRLSPKWEANTHNGQAGYGGGMICQLSVPGRGPVVASTLNGGYGDGMHPSQWKNFHLHTVVGNGVDGEPIVSGDSEHFDAKLDGNVVTSSGDVRQTAVRVTRSFTFDGDAVQCRVQLGETQFDGLLSLWVKNPRRGQVATAYEMIPFVPNQPRTPKTGPKPPPTTVTLADADGKDLGELTAEPQLAKSVKIDRGGFGVTVDLNEPHRIHRGTNNSVLIELTDKPIPASEVKLAYRLVPFNHPIPESVSTTAK